MEQARRDRGQKQAVEWDLAEQGQKEYLRLKTRVGSFAGWEEVWGLAEPDRAAEWDRARGVEWAGAVIAKLQVFRI
jgi:hypothetical protein